ncbi:MAG: SMP-30/gluconolactonase/LRE family protein [Phycisphaerae bacterium]|nr:SMP-30/gluconolactonase/LRE family protein [Phycisphaerae bacterium]
MKRFILSVIAMAFIASGCNVGKIKELPPVNLRPQLFVDLGPTCSVPDGMAIDSNGDIILAVPNYIDYEKLGSKIVKIDKNRKVVDWFVDLPRHRDTGEVHPMGIEFGPDGNLYIADNQYFVDKNYKSRLLRVIVKDGKPVRCEVAVDGFKLANAVRWKGNDVYVSDTYFDLKDKKNQSGIYRISLDEMNKNLVSLQPEAKDRHLIAQFTAKDNGEEETAGADGVCFDSNGNLYCGNFGDGVISRVSFDENDHPIDQKIVVDSPSIECCDGIICDTKTDKIYITNSKNNSVHIYDINANSIQTLWVNDDDNGANGLLDQPCEPIIRDNYLMVVNFDMTFPGLKNTENDQYNTISIFKIK